VKTIEHAGDLRALLDDARAAGSTVGFVPTMGFFHEGHRSLMRAARAAHDVVVVSLFVNPLQFGPTEDLDRYPRDTEGDTRAAEAEGVDYLFSPPVDEMYPGGRPLTAVHVDDVTDGLCGAARPGFFDGVATVVTKLFSIVGPCTAYFGRKDFQQLTVVRRLVSDLSLPVEVVGCPLVREPDGLAMSSRNAYLDPDERAAALVLVRALRTGAAAVEGGVRDPATLRRVVANAVTVEPAARLEYVEVVRAADMTSLDTLHGEVLVALAARVGSTRLIDNVTLVIDDGHVTSDLGVVSSGA
jgi:pantoate--beta-alanine ligase